VGAHKRGGFFFVGRRLPKYREVPSPCVGVFSHLLYMEGVLYIWGGISSRGGSNSPTQENDFSFVCVVAKKGGGVFFFFFTPPPPAGGGAPLPPEKKVVFVGGPFWGGTP